MRTRRLYLLLAMVFESTVGRIGDLIEVSSLIVLRGDESRRVPSSGVKLHARVDAGAFRKVVHDSGMTLAQAVIAVRAPAILCHAADPETAPVRSLSTPVKAEPSMRPYDPPSRDRFDPCIRSRVRILTVPANAKLP